MKELPTISHSVAAALSRWLAGVNIGTQELSSIVEFYQSLDIKHNSSETFYRGLVITKKGFDELIATEKLQLKKRVAESWTCDLRISKTFMPRDSNIKKSKECGIVLKRKIPNNKVKFNLQKIWEVYADVWKQVSIKKGLATDLPFDLRGYILLEGIGNLKECELVTDTICTSCSVGEMSHLRFKYDESMLEFLLSNFDLDMQSVLKLEYKIDNQHIVYMSSVNRGTWRIDSIKI